MSFFSKRQMSLKDKSYSLNAIIKTSSTGCPYCSPNHPYLILVFFCLILLLFFFLILLLLLFLFLFFLSFLFMPIQTINFTTKTTLNPNQRTFGTFSILWESFEKSSKKMFSQPNYPPKESLSIGLILLI